MKEISAVTVRSLWRRHMMRTRRTLFVLGALLAVGVLLAPQAAFAQTPPVSANAVASGYDSVLVNWVGGSVTPIDWTGFDVGYSAHPTESNFSTIIPQLMPVGAASRRATITGLMSNTRYVVGVRSKNATTQSAWVIGGTVTTDTLPAVPQVTGLALEPGDGMIGATWNAVTDPLGITGYELMVTAANGFSQTLPVGNVTQYDITGLANDTAYTVTVVAVANNEAGATGPRKGAASASMTATPIADTTDPGDGDGDGDGDTRMAVMGTVGTVTHDSIMLSWEAVDGALGGYNVGWAVDGSSTSRNAHVASSVSSYSISDLMPETTYRVWVCPRPDVADCFGSQATTMAAPPPDAPGQPVVNLTEEEESLVVSWLAVEGATMYKVQWRTARQTYGDPMREAEVMDAMTYTIVNLTGGMEHMVQVMAGNAGGYGPASDEVMGTPMETAAAPMSTGAMPTDVALTPVGRDTIKVTWAYSGEGTETAIRFDVGWTEAAGTEFTDSLAPQTIVPVPGRREARSYTLENLTINDEYLIAVRAVHGDGAGGQIAPTPADWAYQGMGQEGRESTPADVSQVQNVNVMAGDGELMVTWDEVTSVGTCVGAPIPAGSKCGYLLDWRAAHQSFDNPDRQMKVTEASATITGLMNGTEYGVIVRSYNERGSGLSDGSTEAKQTPMMPTPALPVFGVLALGAGLVAAGRRRLRAQRQLKA